MQKNNRSLSKSAAFLLVAIVAFLNTSCSTKISTNNNLVIPSAVASSNDDIEPLINYLKQQKMGKIKPEEFQVIWQSPSIPPSLIVVSQKLSTNSIKRLKTSFLNTPEGIQDIFAGQSAGYTSIEDADYTPILELRANLKLKSESVQ
jgi:ABC-type phosphate/phosphonate transport system substrate-binding protein